MFLSLNDSFVVPTETTPSSRCFFRCIQANFDIDLQSIGFFRGSIPKYSFFNTNEAFMKHGMWQRKERVRERAIAWLKTFGAVIEKIVGRP